MRKQQPSRSFRARLLTALVVASPILASVHACTDLTETPASAITPGAFYQTPEQVRAALASVYAQLRYTLRDDGDYWAVSEVSSDEMLVPTRGTDWFDGGRWLELDAHNWSPTSASGGDDLNGAWVAAFTGIARANVVISALPPTLPNRAVVEAELRTLRAFYYYQLLDMFGGVPIVTTPEIAQRERATRSETFKFIEDELNATRLVLPPSWDPADHGRLTSGAADAILASLYINAGVFNKDDGVSTNSYNSCQGVQVTGGDACQAAIAAANRILNSPQYSLATDWRSNFTASNDQSPENIMVVKHLNVDGLGMTFLMRALHYTQLNPSPWNGFSTLAEVYNSFDADDQRRQIFLVGPQVNLDPADEDYNTPVFDRTPEAKRVTFTPEIGDIRNANEHEGVRIAKWPPDPAHSGPEHGNDFAYFRLAEIYLIKAEALNEQTPGSPEALALVNTLRARVFNPPEPLATIDRAAILRERLFELAGEAKRRQDLIRHGQFTRAWQFKGQTADHRILMSIPQQQMDANPKLRQNPGY
jgi:hypothetical protein